MTPSPIESPSQPLSTSKRLAIWAAFLFLVYLIRDFFFLAFMTFMFSYLALAGVAWGMRRISPNADRPALRRLLTVAVFVLIPLMLSVVGYFVMPKMIAQAQRLAGWASQMNPESEVARILETYVGPFRFRQQYGTAADDRYQKALAQFQSTGERHVADYLEFPKFEAWVEGGFNRQFTDAETGRIRSHLLAEGTSSKDFEEWFVNEKVPALRIQANRDESNHQISEYLVRSAVELAPEQLLAKVRHEPAQLSALEREWIDKSVASGVAAAKQSPAYMKQFQEYYDRQRQDNPRVIPYTFEQFNQLQKARPQGRQAFGNALHEMGLSDESESNPQLRKDFEASTKHELFEQWWSTSSFAKFIRKRLETGVSDGSGDRVERLLTSILNIPIDLATALLLSFFICIDFPRLQQAGRRLRQTWLRDVYDEIVPALSKLGLLVGRAMRAQGIIALCNSTLIFFALTILGVEHAVLLAGLVFLFCLVPTIGLIIAWVILVTVALIQPGGGLMLALKVTGAVAAVVCLENLVFSPRILGKMLEMHPVLIIAVIPLAQYFFGIWGLILALPVTVFVIQEIILRDAGSADETPKLATS